MSEKAKPKIPMIINLLCALVILMLVVMIYMFCTLLHTTTKADIKGLGKLEAGKYSATLDGYMSPLLGDNGLYFYLTDTPYTLELSAENSIPVYLKSNTAGLQVVYSNQLLKVHGTLLVSEDREYKDGNGYSYPFRLIDATWQAVDNAEFEQYNLIAATGLYEDLYMYYGLYNEIINNNAEVTDEIETELFDDMIIMLASQRITDSNLAKIINQEASIAKAINAGDDPKTLKEEYDKLAEMLVSYFKEFEV